MRFFIALFLLLVSGSVVFLFLYIRKRRHTAFVVQNSQAIKALEETNGRYVFADIVCPVITHTYDNEKFYNTISCQDYLIYQLQFEQYDILKQINKTERNKAKYKEYCIEISKIDSFGAFWEIIGKYNRNLLCSIEKSLFEKNKKHPLTEYFISVVLNCSKINGTIYLSKQEDFSTNQVKRFMMGLNDKRGSFYNNREIWDAICRVERGKVSNKMRFSIYERDGYRCRYCGRIGYDHDLEIDHIKPISKGGKSTYDNLQTLCKRCNQQKGNAYFG